MGMKKNIELPEIDALIFDLDGVVTQTRNVHMEAWRKLFDEFFRQAGKQAHDTTAMSDADYLNYLDGKPRYQGVRSFLSARGVELPFGNPDDPPGFDTVCAAGNRKNELFRKEIEKGKTEVYEDAVSSLRLWREQGIKTAIVSSSKNCKMIIEQAGIDGLFDVRVDGLVSEERGLKGKPDPDIFVVAARELGARPEKSVVFEDAIPGVQAGQAGFFGLVVGVGRYDNREELMEHGADIAIKDFHELDLGGEDIASWFRPSTPMVFSDSSPVFASLAQKQPAFFLDYDGTLTPIVQKPEDAILSPGMRETLKALADLFPVAVITGRDMEDVQKRIMLDNIIYSGSHGYVTSGPGGLYMEHEKAPEIVGALDKVEKDLEEAFGKHAGGIQIDRKRYAIAVHYRNADRDDIPRVFEVVEQMLEKHPGHKTGEGKMVVEIKPDIDWHKGKAVEWILEELGLDKREDVIPLYIGDDVTDEDAFMALTERGLGILVENRGQDTAATYSLKNVYQVRKFFERIIEMYSA